MERLVPYVAMIVALVGAGISWGVNDNRIDNLEEEVEEAKQLEQVVQDHREAQIRIEMRQLGIKEMMEKQQIMLEQIRVQTQ